MSTLEPYVEYKPGELIAAEIMNDMQTQIRADIADQAQDAVNAITQVPSAQDADHLEGQSLSDITQAIIDQAISQFALRSGYMRLYKKLRVGEEMVIDHQLQNSPLVDLYQLDYFLVVASEDDYKYLTWVNFFLYHSSEKRIRFAPEEGGGAPVSVEIEPSDGEPYRIPFAELLARYEVEYTDNSSLGEIENELWDAIFAAPNDRFDDQQYAHSPWFDRCCREERTVKNLKQKGDWDDMWIKLVPRKTGNYECDNCEDENGNLLPTTAPTMVQVSHFSFNKLGLTLLRRPLYPQEVIEGLKREGRDLEAIQQELKLMVLLRA